MAEKFYDLKVKDVIKETSEAITIVFEQPEEKFEYKSGQFLTLINEINGKEERRAYSLNTSAYVDEDLAVTVKRVQGGKVSNYLNDNLKAGSTMKLLEPMGNFTLVPGEAQRHVVLFGGGSGITPMMSILKTVLEKEPQSIVSLIYVNKNQASTIFFDKLESMAAENKSRFRLVHYFDEDNAGKKKGFLGIKKKDTGLLNKDRLTNIYNQLMIEPTDNVEYYMCGPTGMMDIVQQTLKSLKVPADKIHKESFVSDINPAAENKKNTSGAEKNVTILMNGEEMNFTVKEGNYILQTGLDKGFDLPFSCQSGLCTACMGILKEGEIDMSGQQALTDGEIEKGQCLTCVGKPVSDNIVIEIE